MTKMTAGSGSGLGRLQNSKITGARMKKNKKKNMKKADLNKDGKLSSYEKKRGMAIMKAMAKKKKKKGGKKS
jgi:hypothetical protein|tara:strand:- start:343 stop:558 length:216 start_codon:yes stop_codon:yes gene_type:complete